MRINPTTIPPTIFETFPRIVKTAAKPTTTTTSSVVRSSFLQIRNMAQSTSTTSSDPSAYAIQSPPPPTAASVELSPRQTLLTTSVLDLFAGFPTKRKLTLWTDNAVFTDPLTIAEGRKQYEAQWYGLKAVFSEIERLECQVLGNGNPIEMRLKTRYKVKGIGSEQVIDSKVMIHTTEGAGEQAMIAKVEDKWDGKELSEGPVAKALKNLNSVAVPVMVSVPNSVEEEEASLRK